MARSKKSSTDVNFDFLNFAGKCDNEYFVSDKLCNELALVKKTLEENVIEQTQAVEEMVDTLSVYYAELNPDNRPIASFLLLGNTGVGKTKSVEALALALHNSETNIVKIDCGEFISEHESAKLLGAPPGYLGHRETIPLLSQQKLTAVTTANCGISIVLLDEVEKAAHSVQRIFLNILDKGFLTSGDNSKVDFRKSIIFLTSNLGLKELSRSYAPGFGLNPAPTVSTDNAQNSALFAATKHFNPEFWNRIDKTIVYNNLSRDGFRRILYLELKRIQSLIIARKGTRAFYFDIDEDVEDLLLTEGVSEKYGARELKRVVNKKLLIPLANVCNSGQVGPGELIKCVREGNEVRFRK